MRCAPAQPNSTSWLQVTLAATLLLVLVAGVFIARPLPGLAAETTVSPEQQLVERYAPHIVLRQQAHACDPAGEPYMPLPIDAVLGDPRVMLRENTGSHDASFDPIITYAPGVDDIAGMGEDFYLDFPGNPLEPGCFYEQWSREKEREFRPTIYARIATTADEFASPVNLGTPAVSEEAPDTSDEPILRLQEPEPIEGLAIQYWFFYLFNDFNNKHEGDWEMIQINFDVNTVEEALHTTPTYITAAQHGGGERTEWDAHEFALQGTHPLVYSAAGSHATHFEHKLFVGWGQNGTGFGCDDTRSPGRTHQPDIVLIPPDYHTDPAFSWLTFDGRWGEKQTWEFNGPRGPQHGKKWTKPVSWISNVRENSLYIPNTLGLGPMPGKLFCGMADLGSGVLIQFTLHPRWTIAGGVVALAAAIALLALVRRPLVYASSVYFRYRGSIGSIAVVLIPLGFTVTVVQQAITAVPPFKWVTELIGTSEAARLGASLAVGELLSLVEALVIAPAVIATMEQIRRNQRTDAPTAWRSVRNRFRYLLRGWISISLRTLGLALTFVGIPLAVRNLVRWTFFSHAVMIEDQHEPAHIRAQSAAVVKGGWFQVALQWAVLSLITILPGPIIGIVLMVVFSQGIEFVNMLSSVVYAYVMPFKAIALTILYYKRTNRIDGFLAAFRRTDTGRASVERPLSHPASAGD